MKWYQTVDGLKHALEQYGSFNAAAKADGVHGTTVHRWARKLGVESTNPHSRGSGSEKKDFKVKPGGERPGATITDTEAVIISRPSTTTQNLTPDGLLRDKGLDPDDYEYTFTVNQWDALIGEGEIVTLYQVKVSARKKSKVEPSLLIIDSAWKPPKPKRTKPRKDYKTVFVFPDPHAPDYEPELYQASLELLDRFKPETVICLGDAADANPFKRHSRNPRTDHSVADMQRGTYELLAGWRSAAPNADMHLVPGNHDWWLKQRVLEQLPQAWELKHPVHGHRLLGIEQVLGLDSLHITLHDRGGEYHDNTFAIARDLVALHGVKTGKHGGSAKEHEHWEGASNVQGHDHKTAMFTFTKRLPGGGEVQRYSFSAGTMAKRDLGYNHTHNCNQSFMVFTVWDDERWHPEFALFDPQRGDTTFRDIRISA